MAWICASLSDGLLSGMGSPSSGPSSPRSFSSRKLLSVWPGVTSIFAGLPEATWLTSELYELPAVSRHLPALPDGEWQAENAAQLGEKIFCWMSESCASGTAVPSLPPPPQAPRNKKNRRDPSLMDQCSDARPAPASVRALAPRSACLLAADLGVLLGDLALAH